MFAITYPFNSDEILNRQKSFRRKLLEREGISYITKRIALLGGSTITHIKNILEIFLLNDGIKPEFYESEYNKFYEDAVFGNPELDSFKPEIIIVFTSIVNILNVPAVHDSPEEIESKLEREFTRFKNVWENLSRRFSAIIVQNNFDFPPSNPEGNFDAEYPKCLEYFMNALNAKFSEYSNSHNGFYIHDINRLSAQIGLEHWHKRSQFYAYKFALNYDAFPHVAWNLRKIISAMLGRSKKCLVLDLDNTLWGGIIGEDGLNGISIGNETPLGEAYTEFQKYVKRLKERGIILAVCSKNDEDIAKLGFTHPDSVLKLEDFAAFHANWNPKNINIKEITHELNIGLDSLVFIDDNPAEREIVRRDIPEVSVPDFDPQDIFSCIKAIEANGYFEVTSISEDDMKRSETYRQNIQRHELEENSLSYDDFLSSLEMTAEISPFKAIYFDRITQLTNKTNQFNLTTRRYTLAEIQEAASNPENITLCCRLKDKFGDNGIISVIIAEVHDDEAEIILWLMSCRVLKRGVDDLMLDCVAREAMKRSCRRLRGIYIKTKKNSMVENLYRDFGFRLINSEDGKTEWEFDLNNYVNRNKFIKEVCLS